MNDDSADCDYGIVEEAHVYPPERLDNGRELSKVDRTKARSFEYLTYWLAGLLWLGVGLLDAVTFRFTSDLELASMNMWLFGGAVFFIGGILRFFDQNLHEDQE